MKVADALVEEVWSIIGGIEEEVEEWRSGRIYGARGKSSLMKSRVCCWGDEGCVERSHHRDGLTWWRHLRPM